MHEMLIDMVRRRPALVADLLVGSTKVSIPDFREARLLPGDFTVVAPTEYRADQVVALYGDGGDPALALVVEVQFGRDHDKRRSWPVYVTTAHARLGCPTSLVVMCLDDSVARWCGTPIKVGDPDFTLTPTVVGPASVPIVDEVEEVRANLELAVLSALTHRNRDDPSPAYKALIAGMENSDPVQAKLYIDLLLDQLPAALRSCLEKEMTIAERQGNPFPGYYHTQAYKRGRTEGEADGEAKGLAEGEAKGLAEGRVSAILVVLGARGIEVSDQDRDRLSSCADLAQLDEWVVRSVTARNTRELFA